jgi:hypothetical protein
VKTRLIKALKVCEDHQSYNLADSLGCASSLPLPLSGGRLRPPTDCTSVTVTYPLDRKVEALLGYETTKRPILVEELDERTIVTEIHALVKRGKQLFASGGRAVTQIAPDIVVKTGMGLDVNELTILEHIHCVSRGFPAPQPLGSVVHNGTTYLFMTFIQGISLQELWGSLTADQKTAVRNQLSTLLLDLRNMPLPSTKLGGGDPTICKDVRRSIRSSPGPIYDEDQFNDFLVSTTKSRITQTYKTMIRTKCLQSTHRIVMTHGDFHLRNILATLHNGNVEVNGIIDWEAGGAYPEYWEFVKSLNTMSPVEEEDWVQYLPEGMGEYYKEWAVDMVLETIIA